MGAEITQLLESLIGVEHREWLDVENNADRWFNHENHFTAAERRILMTRCGVVKHEKNDSPPNMRPSSGIIGRELVVS